MSTANCGCRTLRTPDETTYVYCDDHAAPETGEAVFGALNSGISARIQGRSHKTCPFDERRQPYQHNAWLVGYGGQECADERDQARQEHDLVAGKLALVIEAYWLAIADLPHAAECAAYDEGGGDCTCWRTAADKVPIPEEALALCTRVRDLEDELHTRTQQVKHALATIEHAIAGGDR